MSANDGLVFGKIDAEVFIIGNITFDPLDVGAKLTLHIVALGDIAFDDEFS